MSARYDYSEWDGTQEFADLDPDDLLAGLTDDLLAAATSTTAAPAPPERLPECRRRAGAGAA